MKLTLIFSTLLIFCGLLLFFPASAQAVCPVCTVAVAGGLGFSRWLGIDDSITGVWIGGLILSTGLWLADWMGKQGWKIPAKEFVAVLISFLLVIPPLYFMNLIGLPGNDLWGVDKIILGTLVGSELFLTGVWLDKWLRTFNQGKVFVYYQKVILPVTLLTVSSGLFYLITK